MPGSPILIVCNGIVFHLIPPTTVEHGRHSAARNDDNTKPPLASAEFQLYIAISVRPAGVTSALVHNYDT